MIKVRDRVAMADNTDITGYVTAVHPNNRITVRWNWNRGPRRPISTHKVTVLVSAKP